jgi:fructose-bisphosphate aldolase class I
MLFRASEAMRSHISGVILYDETIRQKARDGTPLPEVIKAAGSIPGIKVDTGAKPLPGRTSKIETVTEGLDGLRERLAEYYKLGARFAKWRAVITIADGCPTWNCVKANAHALARYAALCQEAGLVPIVEPEVLMDGPHSAHDIDRCYAATEWVLKIQFSELYDAGVALEGIVLKPNMVIAGQKCSRQAGATEVAEKTLKCLKATVPAAVPGIAFLSGGQSDQAATENLSLMNALGPHPWALTFSYGRALQAAALKAWAGRAENTAAGQRAFSHRAKMNSLAASGKWSKALEKAA